MGPCKYMIGVAFLLSVLSCEVLDNDIEKHEGKDVIICVELDEVAEVLSDLPLNLSHMQEVHDAVTSSSMNGYDEEYTMRILFESPGKGVGDIATRSGVTYKEPLRNLIESYVRAGVQTRAGGKVYSADAFLNALTSSDIQIYWPYSENWDGKTLPIITFDPEDGSEYNIGYRLIFNDDGSRSVESVEVDEGMATESPVWVINRNSDAEFTTLEMLRREDPEWGEGGGTIIVKPGTKAGDEPLRTLILKEFKMNRQFDSWFCGAAEVFIKTGSIDDFTASTEAELRLFNPMVTDFMIVVKRSQVGHTIPFNAVLVSDWNPQMTHCALMITEDDGGTMTEWKCTALVRIASKSYGVELNLPFNSRDDIVWRGHLTNRWLEANSNKVGHFGDVDLTFELVEYNEN